MVVTSDSNQYKVFISLLGNDADAAHVGEKISEQPYIGVLFKSQNASTWTPSQYEDLMFKIFRAEFTLPSTAAPSKLILENGELGESNGGSLGLRTNPFVTAAGSDQIRIFHSNHGMQSSLNYVQISGAASEIANNATAAQLSTTGTSIEIGENHGFHSTIGGSAVGTSNTGTLEYLELKKTVSDEIIAYSGFSGTNNKVINFITNGRNHTGISGSSTGKTHASGAIVECYNFDGIPLTKINKTHSGGINKQSTQL